MYSKDKMLGIARIDSCSLPAGKGKLLQSINYKVLQTLLQHYNRKPDTEVELSFTADAPRLPKSFLRNNRSKLKG
jgi:hypothetical protein